MRRICKILLGAMLLQGAAYGAQASEIEVVDGKISMSIQAMPLSRVLSLLDKAVGTTSKVKPELANRNISAQFTGLEYNLAVRKIFEGQPLNYVVIMGRGIQVTDLAQAGAGTSTGTTSSFSDASQPFNSNPIQPFNSPPPLQQGGPNLQQQNPQQNPNNPAAITMTPFGPQPAPAANATPNSTAPLSAPGQLPPALGATNPLISPIGGGANTGMGNVGGGAPSVPSVPAAPGTLGGAAPGTIK